MGELKLKHDKELIIATGISRKETSWKNKKMHWSNFLMACMSTTRTAERYSEYISFNKAKQDAIKDVGGYVGGYVKNGRRKAENIELRHVITLDIDNAENFDAWEHWKTFYGDAGAIYTTHKHKQGACRYRLLIPLKRALKPDEYEAVARKVAADLNIEVFDPTTFEPSRLMFWPSTAKDGEFVAEYIDGAFLDPDSVLNTYEDWTDCSLWPVPESASRVIRSAIKKQGDPLEKTGLIGLFCRRYSIPEVIETFLKEEYEPTAKEDRYSYKKGSTTAGLVIYDDIFAYSHHGTDPTCQVLCNAFDLVRLHKFGIKDEDIIKEDVPVNRHPSFIAMQDFVRGLPEIAVEMVEESLRNAREDFGDDVATSMDKSWMPRLEVSKKGVLAGTLQNLIIILENDPNLKGIRMNRLAGNIDISKKVPWDRNAIHWTDEDDAQLESYVDKVYKPAPAFAARHYNTALIKVASDRAYHPIKKYLEDLPKWDKVERLDTLLIDYLGAEDNSYIRAVTRKTLVAAVRRIKIPGCKFDNMPVLCGRQGLGKSTLIQKLGMQWFNDSLNLSDAKDKTAAEKLQGYWILEIGELAGMRKAEVETLRSFISRQDDKYRPAYARRVMEHKRQCVFIGTTNAENGYLRDVTGNRRFWPVDVAGDGIKKVWDLADEDILQIWAEAKYREEQGEKLYLDTETEKMAKEAQKDAMETDDRLGLVLEYLEKQIPTNWEHMPVSERKNYYNGTGFDTEEVELIERTEVTNIEIWAECFGKPKEDMKSVDSYAISAIMSKVEGWEKTGERKRNKYYGQQRLYKKVRQEGVTSRCDNKTS